MNFRDCSKILELILTLIGTMNHTKMKINKNSTVVIRKLNFILNASNNFVNSLSKLTPSKINLVLTWKKKTIIYCEGIYLVLISNQRNYNCNINLFIIFRSWSVTVFAIFRSLFILVAASFSATLWKT